MTHLVADVREEELEGIETAVSGNTFIKTAHTAMEIGFLNNEYFILNRFRELGINVAPTPIKIEIDGERETLYESYLGEGEPVTDEVAFRRNCAWLLFSLRKAAVVHGDLTRLNIVVKDNFPYLTDFHQSRFEDEPGPDKRPEGDAYHLWQAAEELSPDTSRHIRKWRAIRPYVQEGSILDVGCAEGDYLFFAAAENPERPLTGIDNDFNAANRADMLLMAAMGEGEYVVWDSWFTRLGRDRWAPPHRLADSVFFMSVYAHMVNDMGRERADFVTADLVNRSDQVFFETQLHGDGPGVPWHKTTADVREWLGQFGDVQALATIPVHGREPFTRTVFRVRKRHG